MEDIQYSIKGYILPCPGMMYSLLCRYTTPRHAELCYIFQSGMSYFSTVRMTRFPDIKENLFCSSCLYIVVCLYISCSFFREQRIINQVVTKGKF